MMDERFTWTPDDDMQLVEAVLRNVRNGGSAIDGCREYAKTTNGERSVDASKFRFHTRLKDQYAKAYEIAKREGKSVKQSRRKYVTQNERYENIIQNLITDSDPPQVERNVELADIMLLLKKYMQQEPKQDAEDVAKLRKENEKLAKQVADLRNSNIKINKAFNEIEHDYKNIKQALNVLKSAGLALEVPQPVSTTKYVVGADGLIETVE